MHSHWHFFYGTSLWTQKVWTIYVDANPSPFKDDDDDDDDDDNDNICTSSSSLSCVRSYFIDDMTFVLVIIDLLLFSYS